LQREIIYRNNIIYIVNSFKTEFIIIDANNGLYFQQLYVPCYVKSLARSCLSCGVHVDTGAFWAAEILV